MTQHKTVDRRKAATDEKSVAQRLAAQKEKQGQAARNVATPSTTGSTGTYYSPREYGTQSGAYAARVDSTKKAMEEHGQNLGASRREVQSLYEAAKTAEQAYQNTKGKFRGANAAQYERQMLDSWTTATRNYADRYQAFQKELEAYQPYEDAYNAAVGEYDNYVAQEQADYDSWRSTVRPADEIRRERQEIRGRRAELERLMRENNRLNDPGQPSSGAVTAATVAGNEARIRELQEYLGAVGEREKLLEEELEWSEKLRWEDLRQNEDFAQRSRYDASVKDAEYDWVNNPGSAGNVGRAEYDRYNIIPHMNADEVAMYNYVYAAQGEKAAKEYLRYLEPVVNRRRAEETEGIQREFARQHPVAASGISVLLNPVSGITTTVGMIAEKATGQEIDPNSGWYSVTNAKNTYRDEVGSVVEENWGPAGSFGYNVGMGMLDMLADKYMGLGLAGGGSGSGMAIKGLMGSRAVAETVIDGKNRGLSDEQAIKLGLVSGAAELITEGIGLDEMLKLPKGMEDAGFWRGALKGFVGEAGEEGLTNLANLAADISIAGDKSEFARNIEYYKTEENMDDAQALNRALADAGISLGLDMLGGGISGGVFGGVDGWWSKHAAKAQQKKGNAAGGAAGEATPSVSEADSSPMQGTGEPLRDGRSAVPYERNAAPNNGTTASDNGTEPVAGVFAQAGSGNVQEKNAARNMNEDGGNVDEGEYVLPGGPEWNDAPGAREQVEQYEARRERQREEARSQPAAAAQRRVKAENLERLGKAQRVSSQELGLKRGTEVKELLELPRYEWDGELWDTVTRIEKETGYKVRTVTGNIGIRLKKGMGLAKGYIDRVSGSIVLNVAHSTVTAGQIGDHELWHWKMDGIERLTGKRADMIGVIERQIREEFGDEELDAVLDKYIDGYGDVYDMDAPDFLDRVYEEIIADAYAGINAFGAEADRFRSVVDTVMEDIGMGRNVWNASEQEDYAAPDGDQRVYTDEDAPPPRDEDFSQVPQEEYDWDGWDDSMADFAIEELPDGKKYVRADRQVIFGNDPDSWSEQVEDYINGKIRRGGNVKLLAEDGDVLVLTQTTAGKLSDNHDSHGRTLDDDAFYLKASAAVHIDELATISVRDGMKSDVDGRHGEFAAKGWQYRQAFFLDFDGKYYRVRISAAQGTDGNVVYNIGKIERRSRPTMDGSSAKSGALGGMTSSEVMVAYHNGEVKNGDARFSMDSEGRNLTQEQQRFFEESKVRDEQGRLMVMYHGTPNGSHTKFRSGTYFTPNREYADKYQNPNASMLSTKKNADAPKTYEVYLNITKPFDTRNPRERKIFMEEYYRQWGTGAPLADSGLPDWTDGMDLQEFIEEMEYDYDGLILDEGATGGYGMEVKSRGLSYVTFSPEQVKNVDNAEPTDDPDIRFSMEDETGEQELVERMAARMDQTVMDLNAQAVAVHNAKLDAEKREAEAKAERKRQSEQRQMERNRERAQQHKEERQRLRREANAVMTDDLQQFGKPQWAKRDTTKRIMDLFDTPAGMKNETKALIEEYLDHILEKGSLEDDDRRTLMTKLIERGVVEIEPDEIMSEGRSYLKGNKIYVSEEMVRELGDDWAALRKKAFGLGVYLTNDRQHAGLDVWNADMASYLPGFFDENETDPRTQLERLLWIAEEGKAEKLSLAEYTQRLAKQEQVSEAELLDGLAEKLEGELKQFARDADVEMRLRGYTKKNIGERMHRQLTRERLHRAADKAHYRETMQTARNRRELNKLQERTRKTLQWLNQNKYRASEEIQAQIQEVLSDIDLYAVGAANELNWHPKYEMTWRELADVYKAAKAKSEDTEDPFNFFTDKELERIVDRLEKRKLEELDVNALNDLFNAAVAIRKAIFDADKLLSFEHEQGIRDVFVQAKGEMEMAKKPRKGSIADKFFNIEQLTPMNVLRQMGGWRPDGAFAKMAEVLEQGEKDVRAYKVKANRILADWLEAHRDWVHKADGQGKDGIWIEVEIPQLEGIGLDGSATFGDTVKVKMTPMQRVHLLLESRNEDNLRHMVGGRTFADPELYSQGKRTEAYAQGITVKMAPETVKALVKDMTPEEMELAGLLDSYYNGLAHDEINRVSNKLYGYNKAMGKQYAPIFTDQAFTKSEFGLYDQTAEGVGNLKKRMHAGNPSYNISALDAFERNVDKTAEFVGMAIPARDWGSLMNWQGEGTSMVNEINHQWGNDRVKYINKLLVDLQGGTPREADVMQKLGDKLLSNYISSIFGFNPSIVLKQAGSLPLAAAYLGAGNMSFDMFRKERRSREFIAKYTQELQWRGMGYSMPETKQLKDKPGWAQKSGKKWVEDVFGGGYITKMDEATASVLWAWAENKVRKEHPGLEVGDQKVIDEGNSPFYKKVAEEFDRAVSHSQSVSDVAHQSTMRRSKGIIARTFTMFRSDSAQTYNALRQMWGEKEYWDGQAKRYADAKTDGGKEKLKEAQAQRQKAAKRIGTVVAATACNALLAELVDFAMAAIKGKLKNYEDEEEERLTALSVLSEIGWGMFESGAGVVVGGDEIAGMLGRFITGEKGYGEEAPGLEQLMDLEDRIATAVAGCKKGDILGAVREVGMAFSTYYAGFPAENMEKFLITGIAKHFAPGLVAGYEDALEVPQKSDLKGMTGAALEVRLGHVMKEYGMELDDEAQAELAKIYEAGYTDAVPSAAPEKVTIDGQERKLGKQAQRQYDKIRAQVVNGELAALIASPFFREADEKKQAKMLKRLYDFAGEKAKEEILEDYESDSAALAEYTEIAGAGGSVADCVIFQTESADMKNYMKADLLREWDAGDAAKELMFRHLISDSQEEEIAELREAGVTFDRFLEVYAMHGQIDAREGMNATEKATEFAHWLEGQRFNAAQKATIKKEMAYFQFTPAEAERYNKATGAGLNAEEALELTEDLKDLGKDPEEVQKWRVAIDDSWNEEGQLRRLKAVGMNDAAYAKCEAAWNEGIAPAAYVRTQEIKEQFDSDGNGSLTNDDWRNLVNSLAPSGIALPGDKEHFNLTNEQMGFLWQMLSGRTSAKNNPFSPAGGEKWLAIKEQMKEDKEG